MRLSDLVNQSIREWTKGQVLVLMNNCSTKQKFLESFLGIEIKRMNGQYFRACAKIEKSYEIESDWYKSKPRRTSKYRPAKEYLELNGDFISTHKLRLKLIREGIKQHQCEICNLSVWNEQPISLELDHINGVRNDNRLENLRVICPNCHSQTPTYKNKNRIHLEDSTKAVNTV